MSAAARRARALVALAFGAVAAAGSAFARQSAPASPPAAAHAAASQPGQDVRQVPTAQLLQRLPTDVWVQASPGARWEYLPSAAELRRRAFAGEIAEADWRAIARDCIRHRNAWPERTQLAVWVRMPSWLPHARIALRSRPPARGDALADNRRPPLYCMIGAWSEPSFRDLELCRMPESVDALSVECVLSALDEGRRDLDAERVPTVELWRGVLELPIRSVERMEQVLAPVRSAELDQQVRQALVARPNHHNPRAMDVYFRLPLRAAEKAVAVAPIIELWRGSTLVARAATTARIQTQTPNPALAATPPQDAAQLAAAVVFEARSFAGLEDPLQVSEYRLVLRGDAWGARYCWEAEAYWAGSFGIPLAEVWR